MGDLRLSLEHMTVLGMSPFEIIETAEQLQVDLISLILDGDALPLPVQSFLDNPSLVESIRDRLSDSPVQIHGGEGFPLGDQVDFGRAQRLMESAATLGIERVIALGFDDDRSRTIDNFGRLCRIASEFGLQVSLEFADVAQVASLEDAIEVLSACAAPNAAITIDILHLVRSGGSPADISRLDLPIGAAQLCDGPLELAADQWMNEAMQGRLIPGEGEFPIAEFLGALPPSMIVGIEVPKGLPWPGDQLVQSARRAVEAARNASPRLAGVYQPMV